MKHSPKISAQVACLLSPLTTLRCPLLGSDPLVSTVFPIGIRCFGCNEYNHVRPPTFGAPLGSLLHGSQRVDFDSRNKLAKNGARQQVSLLAAVLQYFFDIRRMFEMYGRGQSRRRIAYALNAEGVKSPQPKGPSEPVLVRVFGSACPEKSTVSGAEHLEHQAQGARAGDWAKNLSTPTGIGMGHYAGAAFANRFR